MTTISTVDLDHYRHGTADQKAAFVKELGDSFSHIGFAIVKNHGVPQDVVDGAYAAFQKFFSQSDEVKKRMEIEGLAGQRGYTSKGKEHAKGQKSGDLKEFFHIGQTVIGDDPIKAEYPDNIFPKGLLEVETYGQKVYQTLEDSGRYLLRALAEYLSLDVNYFDNKIFHGNSILRSIHYFPVEDPESIPADAVRAAAHEDINLITLLLGASAKGLEAKSRDGEWVPVKPKPDEISINVGDMLQRLTNKRLVSTTHRVINPPRDETTKPRYSMPFFLHPRSEMDLACLESCIDAQHPKQFTDMTAGEYLDERLKEIGLK